MKIESAAFELSAGLVHQLPASNLPEVAFSGRSNVGKSSLINAMFPDVHLETGQIREKLGR